LAEDRQLFELNLADNKLKNRTLPIIQALRDNGSLKILDLSGNEMMDREGVQLADAIRANQTVTNLRIARNKIGDVAAERLANLFKHTENIAEFDCSWNQSMYNG
jgi:Ran GTPase-activating protein (RanGAP) involved in mRNA processing and transport